MRYFERKRRGLFKSHYINGAEKSVSGNGSVEIISSAGVPFKSLKISGKTKQVSNQISKHYDYFTNLDNYIWGNISYTYVIPFPNEWIGKELTFTLKEKSKMEDISFELADDIGLFANTERLLDYSGNIKGVTSDKYTYFRFTAILTAEKTEISDFWNNYSVCVVGKDEDFPAPIKPTPESSQPVVNVGDGVLSIAINGKELLIPSSISINGEMVPLLLSEWDELNVDKVKKRVIYTEGSAKKVFDNTGSTYFTEHAWAESQGYGKFYTYALKYFTGLDFENNGYCNYFPQVPINWGKIPNSSFMMYKKEGVLLFRTDGTTSVEDFTSWVKSKYTEGEPMCVVFKRTEPLEHDITSTDLGQALLSFCMERGESGTLEVKGALDEIPIELTYYSSEVEDVANITIRYTNQNGDDICEPRVESVRQGSKYLIVAPHIDGYKRVSTEVFGVADSDTEIILEYKED